MMMRFIMGIRSLKMSNRKFTLKEDEDGTWGCPELDIKGWDSATKMVEYVIKSSTIPKEIKNDKEI